MGCLAMRNKFLCLSTLAGCALLLSTGAAHADENGYNRSSTGEAQTVAESSRVNGADGFMPIEPNGPIDDGTEFGNVCPLAAAEGMQVETESEAEYVCSSLCNCVKVCIVGKCKKFGLTWVVQRNMGCKLYWVDCPGDEKPYTKDDACSDYIAEVSAPGAPWENWVKSANGQQGFSDCHLDCEFGNCF